MCSVGEDNLDGQDAAKYMPEPTRFNLLVNKCNKCRESPPNVLLRGKDVYCRECFLCGTVHKFKSFLGKHRLVKPNEKVLVVLQDGHPSTALLHFLRSGLDLKTPKKLRFEPIFVYIENKYDYSVSERQNLLKSIKARVLENDFSFYIIPLLSYISKSVDIVDILYKTEDDLLVSDDDKKKMKDVIGENANETNRLEILKRFEQQLLVDAAKALGCRSVFTTDLSIDIASQMLTNISLGRGMHLPLDIGISDTRDPDCTIIRPMRLFDLKELALYNYFNNLEPVVLPERSYNMYGSVQNLMKHFVSNLQVNYPATVTTIVRTGDKLAVDKEIAGNEKCDLCKAPKENILEDLCSAESTNFSHWVSTQTPDYNLSSVHRYNQTLKSFYANNDSSYCFGCNRLSKDLLVP